MIAVMGGVLAALATAGLGIGWVMWQRWRVERVRRMEAEALSMQFEQLYLNALKRVTGLEKLYRQEMMRCNKLSATNHTLRASIRRLILDPGVAVHGWLFCKN